MMLANGVYANEPDDEDYVVFKLKNGTEYRYHKDEIAKIQMAYEGDLYHPDNSEVGVSVDGVIGAYTYVDLGLPSGLLWATCNVGAIRPEQYGEYFAWGETEHWGLTNEEYSTHHPWFKYKFYSDVPANGESFSITKYNKEDGKLVMDSEDDAAYVRWSPEWRIPTNMEIVELQEYTTIKKVENFNGSGVTGALLTSKVNNKTLFLPFAGRWDVNSYSYVGESANFWASTILDAYEVSPMDDYYSAYFYWREEYATSNGLYKNYSCSIRPVTKK